MSTQASESGAQAVRAILSLIPWCDVPAGWVRIGTPIDQIDTVVQEHADLRLPRRFFAKEAPAHDVFVRSYSVSRLPVTIGAWSVFASHSGRGFSPQGPPDYPIDGISWRDAVEFTAWLSGAGEGAFDLPTEEEWERAARGGDERKYPWGAFFDPTCANLAEAGLHGPAPVGSFPRGASPFGLLDMAGNVDEWTKTPYKPYAGAPSDVPAIEEWARDPHITRGGTWSHHRDLARCARRHGIYAPQTGAGFRLVRRA